MQCTYTVFPPESGPWVAVVKLFGQAISEVPELVHNFWADPKY